MGTLYIDRKELTIKLDGNAIAFYINGEREGIVPIKPLDRVVVTGSVNIETSVLNRLCDENISMIFLSGRRMRFHGILHGSLHNNGSLRVKQYEKSLMPAFAVDISHDMVNRKIKAQSHLLEDALLNRPDLRLPLTTAIGTLNKIKDSLYGFAMKFSNSDLKSFEGVLDSIRGYEGSGAAAYFSAYTKLFAPSLNFTGRNKRPPRDPVNAILSLSYTLLHYEAVREIELIGLDPTIGFYHQFDYGRESLASDLIEPLRPSIDRLVKEAFREKVFTERDFNYSVEKPGCYLKKGGRGRFYPLYEDWARELRPEIVSEVRTLASKILDKSESDIKTETMENE